MVDVLAGKRALVLAATTTEEALIQDGCARSGREAFQGQQSSSMEAPVAADGPSLHQVRTVLGVQSWVHGVP